MLFIQKEEKTFSVGPFDEVKNYFLEWGIKEDYYNSNENRLQNFISKKLSEVTEVEYIYCCREDQAYFVWIIINQFDPSVRRKTYEKQKEIIRRFREEMFDFYVVARLDQPPDSIVKHRNVELIYPL